MISLAISFIAGTIFGFFLLMALPGLRNSGTIIQTTTETGIPGGPLDL